MYTVYMYMHEDCIRYCVTSSSEIKGTAGAATALEKLSECFIKWQHQHGTT